MFYVYVLQNKLKEQIYVGSTNDLIRRVAEHNSGKVRSTKRYLPWILVYYEAFNTEKFARNREIKLKYNGNAMKELKKRIGLGFPSTSLAKPGIDKVNSDRGEIKSNKRVGLSTGAGFSLIELLVVIGIIGVLAGALLVAIDPIGQTQKANDSKRKSDLKQIQTGLELYRSDQGRYPASFGTTLTVGSTVYMQKVPSDPKFGNYYYNSPPPNSTYTLKACAEKASTTDPDTVAANSILNCTGRNFQYTSP